MHLRTPRPRGVSTSRPGAALSRRSSAWGCMYARACRRVGMHMCVLRHSSEELGAVGSLGNKYPYNMDRPENMEIHEHAPSRRSRSGSRAARRTRAAAFPAAALSMWMRRMQRAGSRRRHRPPRQSARRHQGERGPWCMCVCMHGGNRVSASQPGPPPHTRTHNKRRPNAPVQQLRRAQVADRVPLQPHLQHRHAASCCSCWPALLRRRRWWAARRAAAADGAPPEWGSDGQARGPLERGAVGVVGGLEVDFFLWCIGCGCWWW